jgi:predicted KAP-like P-loop ATPase
MWRDSESDQDFLNFTEVADQVVALVTDKTLLPISVGVFGGWGSGKSTVLKLVEARLPEGIDRPIVVKFDAWLYQGFDDSRAALMEVVSSALIELATERKTLLDKAKDFASRVNYFRALGLIADFGVGMAFGIPPGLLTKAGAAVSNMMAGAGTEEDVTTVRTTMHDGVTSLKELVRPSEKRTPPKEIAAFRNEFGELLSGLDVTLVLFVDNLDRCLPDVAIATLEAIRLFLFMPRTAFVIAADEGMIRHSVAKHFSDPEASHVRDYLDKVIQVPLRVPQVGPEDLRAYMYSLFVALAAPTELKKVQGSLMEALQNSWAGKSFDKAEIAKLASDVPGLLDRLAIADRLAPILAAAPAVQGNPRIVKRLLNAVMLRELLAKNRGMNVDLATLAKLAVFERCTDEDATRVLYRLVMGGEPLEKYLLPEKVEETPPEWAKHSEFLKDWRAMEPLFTKEVDLKPAVFLSRDVMAPAQPRLDLSRSAQEAFEVLIQATAVTSVTASKVVKGLSQADASQVMTHIINTMREADWATRVPGIHGAIVLARQSPDGFSQLKAFVNSLSVKQMHKGMEFLVNQIRSGEIR